MKAADQARYARQILLAGVGVAGQTRVMGGVAAVAGVGLGHEVAVRYAERAGFGEIVDGALELDSGAPVTHPAAAAVLAGSRSALTAFREAARGNEA